jgi:hypothetical protein
MTTNSYTWTVPAQITLPGGTVKVIGDRPQLKIKHQASAVLILNFMQQTKATDR